MESPRDRSAPFVVRELSDREITEAFEHWVQRPPRQADLAVCIMLGRSPDSIAEFIWDHQLGEPVIPTLDAIQTWIVALPLVTQGDPK